MSNLNSFLEDAEKIRMIDHMNDDHADAVLNYVKAYAGIVGAESAKLLDITPEGMVVEYNVVTDSNICRIAFEAPLKDKSEVRQTLVAMANDARNILS